MDTATSDRPPLAPTLRDHDRYSRPLECYLSATPPEVLPAATSSTLAVSPTPRHPRVTQVAGPSKDDQGYCAFTERAPSGEALGLGFERLSCLRWIDLASALHVGCCEHLTARQPVLPSTQPGDALCPRSPA